MGYNVTLCIMKHRENKNYKYSSFPHDLLLLICTCSLKVLNRFNRIPFDMLFIELHVYSLNNIDNTVCPFLKFQYTSNFIDISNRHHIILLFQKCIHHNNPTSTKSFESAKNEKTIFMENYYPALPSLATPTLPKIVEPQKFHS